MRIQKFLRESGIGSLRHCDDLIQSKKVKVNGVTLDLPTVFLKENDEITFTTNKKKIIYKSFTLKPISFLFHKPKNVLSTHRDDFGRPTVIDIVKKKIKLNSPIFFAGRLDYDARGLMIFSNDGQFINQISHPSHGWQKKYLVTTKKKIDFEKLNLASKNGCSFKGVKYSSFQYKKIKNNPKNSYKNNCIEMTLGEGKKNEIKNIFLSMNNEVKDLFRVAIGKYSIEKISVGEVKVIKKG